MCRSFISGLLIAVLFCPVSGQVAFAQENDSESKSSEQENQEWQKIEFADGTMTAEAPPSWKKVEPKFNVIEVEFSISREEGDEQDGRLTISVSGGGVQGNIDRWKGQFSSPDGGAADEPKVEEIEVSGMKTHLVDLNGSYADRPGGPNSPPTVRENYRMLGAIVETESAGMYFFKFYGPAKTMEAHADDFRKFVESIKVLQ
jgi:hypothetical protein